MATSIEPNFNSSDLMKDFVCGACESKNIEEKADYFCATCIKFFCEKCIYQHDQLYANHSKYGKGETNKWPLTKTLENLLLKCDIHKEKKLETFCQDHSQLCCTDCVLQNHRQCTNVTLISDSVRWVSVDMQKVSNRLQNILYDLYKFKHTQEACIQSLQESWREKLQEIQDMRKKLNSDLDALENKTLNELDKLRTSLKTSLKKDVDKCIRLQDDLEILNEAVQGLCDKSKKDIEFIASIKCLNKIKESESYLKKNPLQSSIIFQANRDIHKHLSKQTSLGIFIDIVKISPDQVLTVKSKFERTYSEIGGICCLPSGEVICITDMYKVTIFDQHYNPVSQRDVSGFPKDICLITSSEVAVTVGAGVQFFSVSNGELVSGSKFQLPYVALGIAHHQGSLYVTSDNAVYHHTLTGSLMKKLYQVGNRKVIKCAVSPAGDRIYVSIKFDSKLITLATDGTLISTFTDPALILPECVHVSPSGHVLVAGRASHTVIQVDHTGRKKLATLVSETDGLEYPVSVCYNTYMNQIIVALFNRTINFLEVQYLFQ